MIPKNINQSGMFEKAEIESGTPLIPKKSNLVSQFESPSLDKALDPGIVKYEAPVTAPSLQHQPVFGFRVEIPHPHLQCLAFQKVFDTLFIPMGKHAAVNILGCHKEPGEVSDVA